MRDFNFFDSYLNTQEKRSYGFVIIAVIAILAVSLMAYYQWMLMEREADLKSQVESIKYYVQSPDTTKKLNAIDNKQFELQRLQALLVDINNTKLELENGVKVDDSLIEKINAEVPENTFLTELTVDQHLVTIRGFSTEYPTIAQFAFNLRTGAELDNILIPSINESNDSYEFMITATLGSGGN